MANVHSADKIQKAMEDQIADLRAQLDGMAKSLSARGSDLMDEMAGDAENVANVAAVRARKALHNVEKEAYAVADVVRENPVTTTTVLATVGGMGLILGYMLGKLSVENRHR